jgi:DNA-directed RNA polymerase subunit RPC12/RpoP
VKPVPHEAKRSGPQAKPEDRHQNTATAKQQGLFGASVRRGAGDRRQVPIAPASVAGRRRSWWYTYRCRTCGAYLFGRAPSLDGVTGARRPGCSHRVNVMAARIYGQPGSGAAA